MILWSRKWQPTPICLPEKSHEQRTLAGYSPGGRKRVGHSLATKQQVEWNLPVLQASPAPVIPEGHYATYYEDGTAKNGAIFPTQVDHRSLKIHIFHPNPTVQA